MVFVAPAGNVFVGSGSQYLESFRCVTAGETITDLNATVQ
jgi:hypothetical protein